MPQRRLYRTPEHHRIFSLPTKQPVADLSPLDDILRRPGGTMSLRPVQRESLYELGTSGGLFGPLSVGTGKTLLSLLAPVVVQSARPILLIPAALIEKTERDRRELSKHWLSPNTLRVMSYERLSQVQSENTLTYYRPDLIILDEAHRVKNRRAGVTRRILRYMHANPETKCVAISGTIISKSIKDFAHIIRWCLKDKAPVPETEDEVQLWADALDSDVNFLNRVDSSILAPTIEEARKVFADRVLSTPGVVYSRDGGIPNALNIKGHIIEAPPVTQANFKGIRETMVTPTGWAFAEAAQLWQYCRELALGLIYRWNPYPPEDWRNARRDWASFVRETIAHSHTLDTELHVAQAVDRGDLDSAELVAWRAVRDSFKPNVVPVWYSENVIEWCARWLQEPGICWVEHTLFAQRLSERTGVPYYGGEGLDAQGKFIEDNPGGPTIASIDANCTGRNLQYKWSRNLIVSPLSSAKKCEQLLGRTHRTGQPQDEVTCDVLFACRENFESWEKALTLARATQDLTGTPKLLLATLDIPSQEGLTGAVWK